MTDLKADFNPRGSRRRIVRMSQSEGQEKTNWKNLAKKLAKLKIMIIQIEWRMAVNFLIESASVLCQL